MRRLDTWRFAGVAAALLGAALGPSATSAAAQAGAAAGEPAAVAGAPTGVAGDPSPHSEIALVSEVAAIRPGEPFHVALHVTLDPGWHTYWINAGDAGLPLTMAWRLPDGFTAGPVQWPVPEYIPVPPLASYGYKGQVLLPVRITPPADLPEGGTVRLAGRAEFLVCEEICLPASGEVELSVPVTDAAGGAAAPDPNWGALVADTRARLPRPADAWTARAWTV
ncbi:MAG: protein-disulfide reductase DsbD family protein, partial [Gemmatimonadota bacterium]|nr:protein-disulfide reductase DsbD family protein [Gemmatimonadota bacterium]